MERLREILSKSANVGSSGERPSGQNLVAEGELERTACPLCGGAGFVRRALSLDHPRFGRVEPCECVLQEGADARTARLERLGNLGTLKRFTFDAFETSARRRPDLLEAARQAREFAANPSGWLVICGPSGSGKTRLAAAVANERVGRGEPVLFMVVPDLLDHLRAGYTADDEELQFARLFDHVRNAPLLVLDEIDGAAATDWAREKLFQIVNHRYNAQLPTVFTTCSPPERLEMRLATRLCSGEVRRLVLQEQQAFGRYDEVGGMSRERLATMTFANFDRRGTGLEPEERESLQAGFRAAMQFAEQPGGWLTLLGVNGCGKTHLAAAIANKVMAGGGSVFFAVVPDLLDYLRSAAAPGRDRASDEVIDRVRSADLLILDDFGVEAPSPWAQEKLFQVVNYRTVAGLASVVTADRSRDELRVAHPRIVSRIFDPRSGTCVAILAPHYSLGRGLESRRSGARPR